MDALARGALGVAPPSSIGLVGHSRGWRLGVLAAAEDRRITALATWAAISSVERWSPAEQRTWREAGVKEIVNARTGQRLPLYPDVLDDIERHAAGRLDILGAAGRLEIPWLIVHGTEDESVSLAGRRSTPRGAKGWPCPPPARHGAGHTFGTVHPWRGETPAFRLVADETLGFLAAHLGLTDGLSGTFAGRLDGVVAVVTGATRGIGRPVAERLAALGAHVVLPVRIPPQGELVAEAIQQRNGHAEVVRADLASLASVRSAAEEIARRHPRIGSADQQRGDHHPAPRGDRATVWSASSPSTISRLFSSPSGCSTRCAPAHRRGS